MAESLLTPQEAAAELDMCLKTFIVHVRHGRIRAVQYGTGQTRKRRKFRPAALEEFRTRQEGFEFAPCQSSKPRRARTTSMTSSSAVFDIMEVQSAPRSRKRGPKNFD
ncbi:MAG: DNA-binding protein [Hyphomicrobium sp.]|nr:MAG: DNA-binding protein [Hyphomicrobium sp.]